MTVVVDDTTDRAFLDAGLHLRLNTQWPFTLPTYADLYHDVCVHVPERFTMQMAPRSAGVAKAKADVVWGNLAAASSSRQSGTGGRCCTPPWTMSPIWV